MTASVSRLDARQEVLEHGGVLRRAAVFGIARVQMQDRGAFLRGRERGVGDLVAA